MLIEELIERLRHARIGATFNFYRDGDGAAARCRRLRSYLRRARDAPMPAWSARRPGYRGARVSGIPFTSERQLTGRGPGRGDGDDRPSHARRAGARGGRAALERRPDPSRGCEPRTGRPTRAEIEGGLPFLAELARGRALIAVGRARRGRVGAPYVRHPATAARRNSVAGLLRFRARRTVSPPLFPCKRPGTQSLARSSAAGTSSTPRARPLGVWRRRSPTRCAARASRSTHRTSTPATSSSS